MKNLRFPLIGASLFSLSVMTASAATLIYEGFNYSDGTISGVSSYNGGTGFAGGSSWVGSTSGTAFSMSNGTGHSHGGGGQPGLGFGSLSTEGSITLTRKSAPGGAEIHRTIDSGVMTTLTSGTAYFSVLIRTKYYSVGNENLAIALGTNDVLGYNNQPVTSSGQALGVALDGIGSNIDFRATAMNGSTSTVLANEPLGSNTVVMLVGEIAWNSSGGSDVLTIYGATGGNDGSSGNTDWSSFTEYASITANLNEANFDTLHIAGQQVSSVDEIRFGQSFADVGVTNIPEPAPAMLGALGALLLLRRRK